MLPDFSSRLRTFAGLIVRTGLNLQPGQRLLIAEPYELQGVSPEATALVEACQTAAVQAGATATEVIWSDPARLRAFAEKKDWRGFAKVVAANAALMHDHVRRGDALLFLQSTHPDLMAGIPAARVNELRRLAWEHFGPVAQPLTAGATNWCIAPATTPAWANAVYADLPEAARPDALWHDIFTAMRVDETDPSAAWQTHLQSLQRRRDTLNARRLSNLRLQGSGTDLTVALPPEHVWCAACLTTKSGLTFVPNLPTEEVFTAPHRESAEGVLHTARPISYGGSIIDGIELEFRRGRVTRAKARVGEDLLKRLLDTDDGASRLGEIALVPPGTSLARSGRLFGHPLLDENTSCHVALGNAYRFNLRGGPALSDRAFAAAGGNLSLLHIDLMVACDDTAMKLLA